VKTRSQIKATFISILIISLAGCGFGAPSTNPASAAILATKGMRMTLLSKALSSTPALDFITLPAATLEPTMSTALTMTALAKGDKKVEGTPEPTPLPSSSSKQNRPCVYMWTSKPLPEESGKLQQALNKAGLNVVEGRAQGFGQYCMEPQSRNPLFGVMQTDFLLGATVSDSRNTENMGRILRACLQVILSFPARAFPGPFPGHVGVIFQSNNGSANLWFPLTRGRQALEKGLDGAELIKSLQGES
jgi:hypothetical protein